MISLANIPRHLRDINKRQAALQWIRLQPASHHDKKQLVFAWAKLVGTVLTPTEVDFATPPGRWPHVIP